MTRQSTPDERAAYTSGLRKLADILEANPEMHLPYCGNGTEMLFIPDDDSARKQLAIIARAIPGSKDKRYRGDAFDLCCRLDGLRIQVIAPRNLVCERVVTGTRTETVRELKPTVALFEYPDDDYIEREVEREIVEWVCDGAVLA